MYLPQRIRGVTNCISSRTVLGKRTVEGESPVGERDAAPYERLPSRPEHEEFRLNPGGPPSKAKYHW